jgi:hypothetical protein
MATIREAGAGQPPHNDGARDTVEDPGVVGIQYIAMGVPPDLQHPLDRQMTGA